MRPDDITYISQDGVRWAWRQIAIHTIPPGVDQSVLLVMGAHADRDGFLCPSQERLAAMTGCSLRSVERSIRRLNHDGLLQIETEQVRRRRLNCYRLTDWPQHSAVTALTDQQPSVANSDHDDPTRYAYGPADDPTQSAFGPDTGVGWSIDDPTPESGGEGLTTRLSWRDDPTPESGKDSSTEDSINTEKKVVRDFVERDVGKHDLVQPRATNANAGRQQQAFWVEEPAVASSGVGGASGRASSNAESPNADVTLAAQMTAIWNEVIQTSPRLHQVRRSRNPALITPLVALIREPAFAGNLGTWRAFCQAATRDERLYGPLSWVVDHPDVVARLLAAVTQARQPVKRKAAFDSIEALQRALKGQMPHVPDAETCKRTFRDMLPEGPEFDPVRIDPATAEHWDPGTGMTQYDWMVKYRPDELAKMEAFAASLTTTGPIDPWKDEKPASALPSPRSVDVNAMRGDPDPGSEDRQER